MMGPGLCSRKHAVTELIVVAIVLRLRGAPDMNEDNLSRKQAQILKARIESDRNYLYRLRTRMAKRGFQADDPLFAKVVNAQVAMGELAMRLALLSWGGKTSDMPKD
jgi:hypothetical protein